jgi:uncharacterized protein (TIGR02145 family)
MKNNFRNSCLRKCSIIRLMKIIPFVMVLFFTGLIRVQSQTVTDIDGNVYNTVTIGTQVWMKENLKTTKYNDGTSIPNITDNTAWKALTTGAYSDYGNTPANSTTYGRMYNWYAVDNNAATKDASNGGKNVCLTDWHVPSDEEWATLENYLITNGHNWDGTTTGNKIAKSMASTSGWAGYGTPGTVGNNQASNNSSGFTALPGGYRYSDGSYYNVGYNAYWWSSTARPSTMSACSRDISYYFSDIFRDFNAMQNGYSVRCVRDLATDITNPSTSVIGIYPNPVFDILTVDNKNEKFETVSLINLQGARLTKVKSITPIQQIDFSKFEPGLYFLEFTKATGEVKRLKVVKR